MSILWEYSDYTLEEKSVKPLPIGSGEPDRSRYVQDIKNMTLSKLLTDVTQSVKKEKPSPP